MPKNDHRDIAVVDDVCAEVQPGGRHGFDQVHRRRKFDNPVEYVPEQCDMGQILPEERIRTVRHAEKLIDELESLRPQIISAIRDGVAPVSGQLREFYQFAVVHCDLSDVEPVSVESVLEGTICQSASRLTPVDLAGIFQHHHGYRFDQLSDIPKFVTIANKIAASGGLYMTSAACNGHVGRLKASGGSVGATIGLRARVDGQELSISLNTKSRSIPDGIQLVRRVIG